MLNTQAIPNEKFLFNDISDDEQITFTGLEWKFFVAELKEMIAAGEFDIAKAIHSARFYAEMTRRTADIKSGKFKSFTDEEWEQLISKQNL